MVKTTLPLGESRRTLRERRLRIQSFLAAGKIEPGSPAVYSALRAQTLMPDEHRFQQGPLLVGEIHAQGKAGSCDW